jgi:hypothetical protein
VALPIRAIALACCLVGDASMAATGVVSIATGASWLLTVVVADCSAARVQCLFDDTVVGALLVDVVVDVDVVGSSRFRFRDAQLGGDTTVGRSMDIDVCGG